MIEKNFDYCVIGNCTSAALIGKDCSIDWLCLPFFDSASIFARILDESKGGYFRISALNLTQIEQDYLYHTAIIKTIFETQDGLFEVRDYMPRFVIHQGGVYCPPEIHRDIHVIRGRPKIVVELKPRPNYGFSEARICVYSDYIKITSVAGEYNSCYLYTNLNPEAVLQGFPIELNGPSYFLLSYHEKLQPVDWEKVYVDYEKTKSYWLDWVYRTKVPDKYKELAIRSIITLKLLMYQRTGAVIAAPTTSLPEIIGKDRNWDYRYCWVRDASMIVDMYTLMGHVGSAARYINFILDRMLLKNENIAVMYGINGERKLEEKNLEHLEGYQGSNWMINALYLIGQVPKAREMFENILKYINKFGLLSEDIEPHTGQLTGNFPQGYSHLALIQTIFVLETDYNWSDATNMDKWKSKLK